MSDKWISVEDRLPEAQGLYIVAGSRHGHGPTVYTCDFAPQYGWLRRFSLDTVTHWQPLPPPPGEVES